jgi:hypothetical protein
MAISKKILIIWGDFDNLYGSFFFSFFRHDAKISQKHSNSELPMSLVAAPTLAGKS